MAARSMLWRKHDRAHRDLRVSRLWFLWPRVSEGMCVPLAHPSTLDHPPWALERGWWVSSWRGLEPGARRGIAGGLSHSGGASIVFVVSFKLGITYQDRFRHEKKATNWSPSHRFGRASPSCRASLPARVEPGVHPHVRSHCSWRVPIDAWMSAEFFINVRREV